MAFHSKFHLVRLALIGATVLSTTAVPMARAQANDAIKIGSIFDLTGTLNIYGIQQSRALQLAVDEINAAGGLLGRQVRVVESDAQSEQSKYTQYANTMIMRDKVSALFAGLTSSTREAIRPIARRSNIPYFYSTLYEGGACDRQTFVTGPSASQQLSVLMKWAVSNMGKKVYVMAPDYNFGTISAVWVKKYAKQFGGEVVGTDFLPLTATDYSSTIQKIQAAQPDFVVALPVGANQTGFIEQFAAAGLKKIGLVSTNYGSGNQQIVISPAANDGIVSAAEYFHYIDTPRNAAFKAKWTKKYGTTEPIIGAAASVWNAVHLWAKAVEKAGTHEPAKVIQALESNLSYEGPSGTVTLEPGSHHLRQSIFLARGTNKRSFEIIETHTLVPPAYENEVCNLIKEPAKATQFVPPGGY